MVPMNDSCFDIIEGWYFDWLKRKGTIMTKFRMDKKIRRYWNREDLWHEATIIMEVSRKQQMECMLSDSFEQYYQDMKPSETKFVVHGKKVDTTGQCCICLDVSGNKIELENCNCLFHRDCIETSVRYRKVCPVCYTSINMSTE